MYDQELAVQLLESLHKQRQALNDGRIAKNEVLRRPREALALALLNLDLGRPQIACQRLLEVDKRELCALVEGYAYLLGPQLADEGAASSSSAVPVLSLGQVLRLAMPTVLGDALQRIGPSHPLQVSLDLIKYTTSASDLKSTTDTADSATLLRPFLEHLLQFWDHELTPADRQLALTELVKLYVSLIQTSATVAGKVSWRASRPDWLAELGAAEEDAHELLLELEGLIAAHMPTSDAVAAALLAIVEPIKSTSLELLLLPGAKKLKEAVAVAVAIPTATPDNVLGFAKSVCKDTTTLWQALLDALLAIVGEEASKDDRRKRKLCHEAYSAILWHLAEQVDPTALLQLLPDQGSLAFFLPILEAALHRHAAGAVSEAVKSEAQRFALADAKELGQ